MKYNKYASVFIILCIIEIRSHRLYSHINYNNKNNGKSNGRNRSRDDNNNNNDTKLTK